ncbi:hypothetical protein FGG78_23420 [Thioclava sp. BHET1]|nr:hypothetical protein FGG78_23420 [Thioclava sp. BHET1]
MADETEIQVDTRFSPSLHPRNISALDGVDDMTAPLVADATEALEGACSYLAAVHDYRAAAFSDPTLTEPAALLKTDDFAMGKLPGVTKRFDGAMARFDTTIAAYERDLVAPVKQKAGEVISTEVRAHLKASPNRVDIVRQAIQDGDDEIAASALGAPAILSGLTPEIHRVLLREYHIARSPVVAQRLKALTSAKAYLEAHGTKVLAEAVKAVGGIQVPVVSADGKTRGHRTEGPDAFRKKRDKSAAVYARHT